MNIVVIGAGSIGSLFGGLLSKNNEVVLIGRKNHVNNIKKEGLKIHGLTELKTNISASDFVKNISFSPEIVIISVKSYDTTKAVKDAKKIIGKNTIVISLQNGLDNIEKILKHINKNQILVCITTHGAVFSKPGNIIHTGEGKTIVGAVDYRANRNAEDFSKLLNDAGIKTIISDNILKDIWIKAIINSSINPLTTIFNCKNGYLIENPILKRIVEQACKESTSIANTCGYNLKYDEMLCKTFEVIKDTKDNYSSMLQSINKNKKTEIDAINGILITKAEEKNINHFLNKVLLNFIKKYY